MATILDELLRAASTKGIAQELEELQLRIHTERVRIYGDFVLKLLPQLAQGEDAVRALIAKDDLLTSFAQFAPELAEQAQQQLKIMLEAIDGHKTRAAELPAEHKGEGV